jgi:hypothetical protein
MNILGLILGGLMAERANLPPEQVNRFRLVGAVLPPTPIYLIILLTLIRQATAAIPPAIPAIAPAPVPPPS